MKEKIINGSLYRYNNNEKIIYYKNSYGFEFWYKYDENGNYIHYKDSNRFECWKWYDENNNLIHYKDSDRLEYWKKYDENNNTYKTINEYLKAKDNEEIPVDAKKYSYLTKPSIYDANNNKTQD